MGSFILSPASIKIPETDWEAAVIAWISVNMPTGSRKSPLFVHIFNVMQRVRQRCGVADGDPTWIITDATFEKMGTLMQENGCRLLGFYDEPTSFLTQINLYRGKNISDSHELSLFLQLCNGHPWRRDTGMWGVEELHIV